MKGLDNHITNNLGCFRSSCPKFGLPPIKTYKLKHAWKMISILRLYVIKLHEIILIIGEKTWITNVLYCAWWFKVVIIFFFSLCPSQHAGRVSLAATLILDHLSEGNTSLPSHFTSAKVGSCAWWHKILRRSQSLFKSVSADSILIGGNIILDHLSEVNLSCSFSVCHEFSYELRLRYDPVLDNIK